MRLGIDLDNTIICYDQLFAKLAIEQQLIPPDLAQSKQAIRDFLRAQNQEDRWTELQGLAYGSRMEEAVPFDGIEDFFKRCTAANVQWWIISHRSERPFLGPPVDLHLAARQWLARRGMILSTHSTQLKLETSRDAKLRSIVRTGCDVFIDDLPELLCDPLFPDSVRRILFDPMDQNPDQAEYKRATSWFAIANLLGI